MQEFMIKLKRIRKLMDQESLYGCYLKRQDNFAWLTCGGINYVGPGDYGNCGLLVTSEELFAITNNIEAPRMREEEQLEKLGFQIISGMWYDGTYEQDTVRKICGSRPVGYDIAGYEKNLTDKIRALRSSLTEDEISRYLEGGEKVSRIMEEVADSIVPGETEWKAASRVAERTWAEGMEPLSVFCSSDERIDRYRHAVSTGKIIQERVQLGGNIRYKGLVIGCTRYVSFRPVEYGLCRQYQDNAEISCRMIAETLPGNLYTTPLAAGKKAYEDLGYKDEFYKHHQGGAIGYQARDCKVDFSCKDVIAENQAFCWNPTITGTKSEDTVITTPEGILFVTRPLLYPVINLRIDQMSYTRAGILEKF